MLADGIHPLLTWEQYRALEREHWSGIKHFEKTPAHFKAAKEAEKRPESQEDSDARAFGRSGHLLCFEPQRFETEVVHYPKTRNGKEWEAFKAANAGKEILKSEAYERVLAACASARKHPALAPFLKQGAGEVSVLWTERIGEQEVAMKARMDWIATHAAILDFKFVDDASAYGFSRLTANLKYHGQAALYVDGLAKATGESLPFILVAVEKRPPYAVQLWRPAEEVIQQGRELYRGYLTELAACATFDHWPAYPAQIQTLYLPAWAQEQT